jgi:hypothetical protein
MFANGSFNLLGRVYRANGDAATAIGMQCLVLRLAPSHPKAAQDLITARAAVYSLTKRIVSTNLLSPSSRISRTIIGLSEHRSHLRAWTALKA